MKQHRLLGHLGCVSAFHAGGSLTDHLCLHTSLTAFDALAALWLSSNLFRSLDVCGSGGGACRRASVDQVRVSKRSRGIGAGPAQPECARWLEATVSGGSTLASA